MSAAAAGDSINMSKRTVAKYVMENCIRPRTDIKSFGLGSGSTIELAMKDKDIGLANYLLQHKIAIIPTSFQAYDFAVASGLGCLISDVEKTPSIDLAIDGADEVDQELNLIKGGGGCFLLEKTVAKRSKELLILGDHSKQAKYLGEKWKKGIPIEIAVDRERTLLCDFGHSGATIKAEILKRFGGDEKQTKLREATRKCGPVITDAGNLILDWVFSAEAKYNWKEVDENIRSIPGVVETGVFVNLAKAAYFGQVDGTVYVQQKAL